MTHRARALSGETVLPSCARAAPSIMERQIVALTGEITALDQQLTAWHMASEAGRRLAAIPGIGLVTATAVAATEPIPNNSPQAASSPHGSGSLQWRS